MGGWLGGRADGRINIKSLRNTIRVSDSLDPDQAGHFAEPDLSPNGLQML